jgi:SNF2 family DNA or RNA helicase
MAAVKELEIRCETKEAADGFQIAVGLSAKGVDEREVRATIASGRYYLVQSDQIFLINPDKLEKLTESIRALTGNADAAWSPSLQVPLNNAQLNDAEAILEGLDAQVELPETWRQRSAALREVGHLKAPPLPKIFDDRLRSYQRIGVAWLWHLYQHDLGGVLADEMGLGKTIQAIGLMLCAHRDHKEKGALALVIAPASLTSNWAREIQKFAPGLRVFVHHRESRLQNGEESESHDVIITSYATLLRDQELFQGIQFPIIIADEAQHIKNRRSQSAQSLRTLSGRGRFVLTGTPIENSLDDLRSIFDFCLPGYLARKPMALKGEEKAWLEQRHQEQAVPYILRRNKVMVAPDLPEKIEQVVYCDLEPEQQKMYREVQERSSRHLQDLQAAGQSENRIRFAALTELLRLRQVCADPGMLNQDYPLEGSAKLQAFAEILDEAIDGGHRILVFSQFVKLLKRLKEWLKERGVRHLYLDGSTRNRLELCDEFNEDAEIPVFLISLKAGGTGLNLTGADTVVHFDPWWNPAVEDQATDRAHRIGQNRVVTSYKLIVSGTVEEKVQVLQDKKSALLRDLLDESMASTAKVSLEEIRNLING